MFSDANPRTQKRTGVIKPLMKRLRKVAGSDVYLEVANAFMDENNSLPRLRDVVRSAARAVPSSGEYEQAASRATKRTQMVDLLVKMLEDAGYNKSNKFTGVSSSAPSLPMDRTEALAMASNQLQQLASVQPPFPYPSSLPDGALVHQLPKVEYTQRLGIVSPSLVQGRVLCPREPDVQQVDGINIVNGIKHVKNFYEGNVIHVRLPAHKFKDGADKCQFFTILREAFDQYRREYAEHSNPADSFWRRRVMTQWQVYLDEGIDSFDNKPETNDTRTILDNDMVVNGDGANGIAGSQTLTVKKNAPNTGIPICVTRFDGRQNVGHVRAEELTFYPQGVPAAQQGNQFNVRNLLRFMYKMDNMQVLFQDWFSHEVRRMIISNGIQYEEANHRANERAINFLKQDQRNALLVIDENMYDLLDKNINRTVKAINDFCKQGREGYERLAVVIVRTGARVSIESEVSTARTTFVSTGNTGLNWLFAGAAVAINAAQPAGRRWEEFNGNNLAPMQYLDVDLYSLQNAPPAALANVPTEFLLQFDANAIPQYGFKKIYTPGMRLVRFSPSTGFYQLVQKRAMAQQRILSDNDINSMFVEQVAVNKPIYIDEQVLAGFINPDMGQYMVTAANPNSDLFVQRVSKFELIAAGGGQRVFILPKNLPAEFFNYLRNAHADPIVIVGVLPTGQAGNCVHQNVEMFANKNGVAVDMLTADKFTQQIQQNEYIFIRTQLHRSTNTTIMYQYKFDATDPYQIKVIQKLYNTSDMEDIPGGWTFQDAAQEMF